MDFFLLYGVLKNTLRIIIPIHGNFISSLNFISSCVLVCKMAALLQALKSERKVPQESGNGDVGCAGGIFCFLLFFEGLFYLFICWFFFPNRRFAHFFLKTTGLKFSKVNLPENFIQWHMH